jgi:hypothetical protein
MSFPNPIEAPAQFSDHLKAAHLDFCQEIFTHYQNKPVVSSDGRLDESEVTEWGKVMDGYFVRPFTIQPLH